MFPSNLTPSSLRWIRRFDSRAIFLRQCHCNNVLLFPRKQLEFSATNLRNEFLGFIHIVFLFKVRAIMLLSTFNESPSDEINSNCFKPAYGGKVAHFENDTASEK